MDALINSISVDTDHLGKYLYSLKYSDTGIASQWELFLPSFQQQEDRKNFPLPAAGNQEVGFLTNFLGGRS